MAKFFSWDRFIKNIPILLDYLPVTLEIVFAGMFFGTILGLLIAVVRIKKIPVLYQFSLVYISFMRGTPMLVQLMIVYYGLPRVIDYIFNTNISREWDAVIFACIGFIINEAAFLSATFFGAIKAVPVGQYEAASSVGLTEFQTYRRIIIPQAVRIALPPYGSDFIGALESTSVVFMIGVLDIVGRAQAIGAATNHTLEAYLFIVVIYVVFSIALRALFAKLSSKLEYGKGIS